MDKYEMSTVLKEAFRLYGHGIGSVTPEALMPLVKGKDAIVKIHLNKENTLLVTAYEPKKQVVQVKTPKSVASKAESEAEAVAETMTVDVGDETASYMKPKPRKTK